LSSEALKKMLDTDACPACGVALVDEPAHPYEASIDRIVPQLGYTDTNTAILCRTCNGLKGDMDIARLRTKGLEYLAEWAESLCEQRGLPRSITIRMKIRRRLAALFRKAADFVEV
jgi:hypothetical protein